MNLNEINDIYTMVLLDNRCSGSVETLHNTVLFALLLIAMIRNYVVTNTRLMYCRSCRTVSYYYNKILRKIYNPTLKMQYLISLEIPTLDTCPFIFGS